MSVKVYISKDKDIRYDVLKEYGISKNDILINEYGKPYTNKGIYFSISHSKNYFVIAVSDTDIGIDIELKRDLDYKEISKRIFKNEINDLDTFFKTWVKYEAYTKFIGKSIFSSDAELNNLKDVAVERIDIIDNLFMYVVTKEHTEIEVILW